MITATVVLGCDDERAFFQNKATLAHSLSPVYIDLSSQCDLIFLSMPALPRFQASKVIQTAVPRLLQRQLTAAADFFGGGGGRQGKKKALLIGITYRYNFTDIYPELHGTTSDVRELKETLISEIALPHCVCCAVLIWILILHSDCYGFKQEDVVVLNDGDIDTMGSETWPTRTNIVGPLSFYLDQVIVLNLSWDVDHG